MNEIKEPTPASSVDGMSENVQDFDQVPSQFADTGVCEDGDDLSDERQSDIAVSTEERKCSIYDDSSTGGDDDFTYEESDGYVQNSPHEEGTSGGISTEPLSDVDSSVSHDPNFMANQNQELKNRDLQKWIQSVERSSVFGENCEQRMGRNQKTDIPSPKSDHQKGVAIETQTDWEWVVSAVAKKEEEEEKEGEEEEDDRPLSFNSTKSSDFISCYTPPLMPDGTSPLCLPDVGLPKILQSARESEKEIVPLEEKTVSLGPTKSLIGLCMFCQNPTKPLPTLEQESALCPEELYCCEEYQKFLEMVWQNDMEEDRLRLENEEAAGETLLLEQEELEPRLCKGNILNKKESKNKVKAAREIRFKQKQQETFQQQQQQQQRLQVPPQGYHTTRQMNTMNYQLSSRRCLEEGWTVRTPYLEQLDFDADIFEVEPGKRMALWRGDESISEGPFEKFYDNGHKFFTIFPDGTGNIFGRLAVLITATKPCHFTYVIYCEAEKRVAAIFEHTGYGTCYHDNRNIRLYIDPSGGVEADAGGAIKRRWQWHRPGNHHVHAPPLQPIHLAVNKYIGIKLVSQCNIQLNFIAKRRSCKINMGVNVKPVNVLKPSTSATDENHFFLEDKKTNIECILSKVRNLIQYANSPKLERILPPIYLTNKTSKLQLQAKQVTHTKKRPKVIVRSEISSAI